MGNLSTVFSLDCTLTPGAGGEDFGMSFLPAREARRDT